MPKLTKRFVETLQGKKKPYFRSDGAGSQFYVRVTPNSKKSYYLQYPDPAKPGTKKRFLLGQHGILTLEQARNIAAAKLVEVKSGGDPQLEKHNKKRELTVSDLAERFINDHVLAHCKPRTQKDYRCYLRRRILPFFGHMKISEVTRSDIAKFHFSMRHVQCEANHCLAVVSKIFNLAESWGLRNEGTNPCKHIKKFPMKARNHYLSKDETERLGNILNEVKTYPDENLAAVYCIQLLLLTGCRLGEIRTLKWEYVDYENKWLRLPDSKTGAKIVYAGATVMGLLEEIKRNPHKPKDNPYVIWGKNPGTCLNNVQKAWQRFRKLAGLEKVRIHDLRHSFASFMVNEGTSLAMIGKLLGHTQVQTTARYAHLMAEPMIQTAEGVTSGLGRLLKIETVENNQARNPQQEELNPNFIPIEGTTIKAPVYLTSEQASKYLNVKQSLMEYWRWKKKGPTFIKTGSRVRYRLEALDAFLQNKSPEQA